MYETSGNRRVRAKGRLQSSTVMKLCEECKVGSKRTKREKETCDCDQVRVKNQRKDLQQKHNLAEEDIRSWDTMPHRILVKIIDCYSGQLKEYPTYHSRALSRCSFVSHSWELAVIDLVVPPNDVFDLRVLDTDPWKSNPYLFFRYLRMAFSCRPAISWTTLYLPNQTKFLKRSAPYQKGISNINNDILNLIAEKTPELRNLSVPEQLRDNIFSELAPKWKNLRKVHINISADNFTDLQINCKFLSDLSLYGHMDERLASMFATFFPNLKSLEMCSSTLSNHVLEIILDGHKNLELLGNSFYPTVRFVWNENEIEGSKPEAPIIIL